MRKKGESEEKLRLVSTEARINARNNGKIAPNSCTKLAACIAKQKEQLTLVINLSLKAGCQKTIGG